VLAWCEGFGRFEPMMSVCERLRAAGMGSGWSGGGGGAQAAASGSALDVFSCILVVTIVKYDSLPDHQTMAGIAGVSARLFKIISGTVGGVSIRRLFVVTAPNSF
jgi:hypothetical protein